MRWICRLGHLSESSRIHVKGGGTWRLPVVEVSGGLQVDQDGTGSYRTCWAGTLRTHRTCLRVNADTCIDRRKA